MKNKAYIINFDIDTTNNNDYLKFHDVLTKDKEIINWWHYLQSSYIIIVGNDINATNISNFVKANLKNKLFFVTQLNLVDHDGWLPKEAWTWVSEAIKVTSD